MKGSQLIKIILYLILILYAIITFIPFAWALSASFKPLAEIIAGGNSFIPQQLTLENYKKIQEQKNESKDESKNVSEETKITKKSTYRM